MFVHTLLSKIPSGARTCHLVAGRYVCQPRMKWRFGWNIIFHYFTDAADPQRTARHVGTDGARDDRRHRLGVSSPSCDFRTVDCLSGVAWTYTWAFRGTPVYVQLLLWGFIALLYPTFAIGIPFTHLYLVHFNANTVFIPVQRRGRRSGTQRGRVLF